MPGDGERDLALASFESGNYPDAAHRLVSLLARTPPDPFLLRLCGMALTQAGQVARGLPYLARARRLAPQDPISALWHGIALHAVGRTVDAIAALHAATTAAPADPAPLIHMSRAFLGLGRSNDAVESATAAATLAPTMPEAQHALRLAELAVRQAIPSEDPDALAGAWREFGLACLRFDRPLEARDAFGSALALAPDDPVAGAWLAMVEHLCGEPVAAIARLRAILHRNPNAVVARLHLASRLMLEGEAAEALALLDATRPDEPALMARRQAWRAVALMALNRSREAESVLAETRCPPGGAEIILHWQRALLAHRARDPAATSESLKRVSRLADDPARSEPEDRLDAHFRLAELHEATGRHHQAFRHWQEGHAILRRAQPFSRPAHLAMQRAVMTAFDRRRLSDGPRAQDADPSPVFIVGLPRTGTSLLEQILSAHPMVHSAGERLAIRNTLRTLAGTADAAEATIRVAALDAAGLADAATPFLAALHAEAPTAHLVLDKMPDNVHHLGFVASLLPGARVICCTRDLRDVGISIFRQRFLGHHPYAHDLADLGWYMAQHRRLLAHWRTALPIPMLELDHNDWITGFDATLRRVLAFLGLRWDPACDRFFERPNVVRTASRNQVREPINARGVGRWRPFAEQLEPLLRELRS